MMNTTMTKRGQVSIPAEIRKILHLKDHQKFDWVVGDGVLHLVPLPGDPVAVLGGCLKGSSALEMLLDERRRDGDRDAQ